MAVRTAFSGLSHRLRVALTLAAVSIGALPFATTARADNAAIADKALAAMVRGATYFRDKLSVQGAYTWSYSADLARRKGEGGGTISPSLGWVQPPGTPAVGAAFLRVYKSTGDAAFLRAAQDTAHILVSTQLLSGEKPPRI